MVRTIRDVGATICYTAPTFYRQSAAFAASWASAGCAPA
jgi:2-aminobenzoate-CoA ligase